MRYEHARLALGRTFALFSAFALVTALAAADGTFETGDTSCWSAAVGIPAPEVFRFTDLDLRDPHVFVDIGGVLCPDITDAPFGIVPAFNDVLADALTMDANVDTFLDLSPLLLFRPLDTMADDGRVDSRNGLCTAPAAGTSCAPDPLAPTTQLAYDGIDVGTCLDAIAGTTSGFSPPVVGPTGPCFVTAPRDVTFDLAGVSVPLTETQTAAAFLGDPPTSLMTGLLRGFLTEAEADAIVLPPDLGGGTLSSLFPGGTGNCASDDGTGLDDLGGTPGWWIYLAFEALPVPYTGP